LIQFLELAFGDPTTNRRYGLKHLGKLSGLTRDQIDRLLPPTIDERIADAENDMLSRDEKVEVLPEDDHNVHLEMHMKAKDTDATYAHIETHKKALSIKKTQPELFPSEPVDASFQQGQGQINPVNATSQQPKNLVAPSQTSGFSQQQL